MSKNYYYIKSSRTLYNILKYGFYCLLLLELEYTNTYYFKTYFNELIINLLTVDKSFIDYKELKDPQELTLELESLIKNILKNLIKKP